MKKDANDFKMIATTFLGLEEALAGELTKLGAKKVDVHNRAVSFYGDDGFMYKANICLRTALRVLKPIVTTVAYNEDTLYDEINKINWEKYFSIDQTLAVTAVLNTDNFNHNQYVAQKCKDAIVDQFRDKYYKRPSVDKNNPDFGLYVFIFKNELNIMLDCSGVPLYKRGYRQETTIASINESLAAGLVLLSGWDGRLPLYDPMCGSGTILIEAALIAANVPPGYFRERYCFKNWPDFNKELFDTIYQSAISKINDNKPILLGTEKDLNTLKKAKENAVSANVDEMITFFQDDFFKTIFGETKKYTLIINPPYGERMNSEDIKIMYTNIGNTLKHKYKGSTAWIISSNLMAFKSVGLKTSRKLTLYNGGLSCKYCKYEMY
ncbi:MAG: THUMP domain-containing class I SAM-dependent RNA methyltransferase [Bacteroidia bacterium]